MALHAQDTQVPSRRVISEARALAASEPVPEKTIPEIPDQPSPPFGTYWSLQLDQAPLPFCPFPGLDLYEVDARSHVYLFDDRAIDYPGLWALRDLAQEEMLLSTQEAGMMAGPDAVVAEAGSAFDFGTNELGLEILHPGTNAFTTSTNDAVVLLHNVLPDVTYLLESKLVLETGVVWNAEQMLVSSGETNLISTTLSVAGRSNLFLRAIAYTLDSDGDGLPDWWEMEHGLDPNSADGAGTGVSDGYKDPDSDGWNNLQEFQNGTNPASFNTPPPPRLLSVTVDPTGTNVTLRWQSGGGPVDHYQIYALYYYSTLEAVHWISPNTFACTTPAFDSEGLPYNFYYWDGRLEPAYLVRAWFPNGLYADSAVVTASKPSLSLDAQLVRGPQGQLYLTVASPPPDLSFLRLTWETYNPDFFTYDYHRFDLPVAGLIDGVMPVPTNAWQAYVDDSIGNLTAFTTTGAFGDTTTVPQTAPEDFSPSFSFVDGRRQMKENLKFLLRAATASRPFGYIWTDTFGWWNMWRDASPADYECYGFHFFNSDTHSWSMDELRPVQENALWRNVIFDDADITNGYFQTGAQFDGNYNTITLMDPKYEYLGDGTEIPLPLAVIAGNVRWSLYRSPHSAELLADVGLYRDANNILRMRSDARNVYGQPILSVHFRDSSGVYRTLTPQGSFPGSISGDCFFETDVPSLQPVDYYFASQTPTNLYEAAAQPMPGSPGFSMTNVSPLLIASVGQQFTVSGWAKLAIGNSSGKYAYLEQYFDKAYKLDASGIVTGAETGLLSPYGEFVPTEPGPTALVTMPDVDAPYGRGTCVVQVIKLQTDVDHNGVMDKSFGGPDNSSQARPMLWWVNDDKDYTWNTADLGHDILLSPTNGISPLADCVYEGINSQRDLEDFARLWICGMPALATNAGYQVTLSWNVSSGSPAINLFNSVETNGGIAYLTNLTTANAQISGNDNYVLQGPGWKIGTVAPGQSFTFPSSYFTNAGDKYLLFEGSGIGKGELVLTISQNGTNVLAQTSAWFDLRRVNDMFEHAHIDGVVTTFPSMRTNSTSTSTFTIDSQPDVALGDAKQLLVLVHGWNNSPQQSESYAQTMFKRLYWAGYQGRFAALRWPTLTEILTYNRSEYIAFRSAAGASAYFNSLRSRYPDYSINAAAHSMGNIVMMEALKLQAGSGSNALDNYVLMEAASPAHCYDTNAPLCPGLFTEEFEHPTPNTYYGYPGAINAALRGTMVNFFNTNDFALAAWVGNQLLQKPEGDLGYYIAPGVQPYLFPSTLITDPREIMAFCARPRTYAVGAQPGVYGVIGGTEVDMHVEFGFGDTAADHSGQYTRTLQQVRGFYSRLLEKFNPSQP